MPTSPEIFATADQPISADTVELLASDLLASLGNDQLLDYDGKGVLVLVPNAEYDLLPEALPAVESIVEARLCSPFYGEGYERGYWPVIAAVLEFLGRRITGGKVWYGPDGTDQLDEVTPEFLNQMWEYWSQYGTRPYCEHWRSRDKDASSSQ